MNKRYSTRLFRKILVPIIYGADNGTAIKTALIIADEENVHLIGIVGIADEESLSPAATPARPLGKILRESTSKTRFRSIQHIRVSHKPWDELTRVIQQEK